MNSSELALARILFHLKVHQAKGQVFEDLFVSVYQKAFPHFIPVKPQGQIGDRKNDGYDKTTGTYYQVFAPEDLTLSEAKAVKKLKEDFKGLYDFWNKATPVKSFHFVMNDKFAGSFPEIEADLAEIKKTYKLREDSPNGLLWTAPYSGKKSAVISRAPWSNRRISTPSLIGR